MNGPAFAATRMGARFFEGTMPKIADELERLNATLTAIASELRASNARPAPAPAASAGPPGATVLTWKATLARIAEQHLQINLRDPRGADARDVRPVAVGALHAALRAAFRAGIAAGVGCLRADDASDAR